MYRWTYPKTLISSLTNPRAFKTNIQLKTVKQTHQINQNKSFTHQTKIVRAWMRELTANVSVLKENLSRKKGFFQKRKSFATNRKHARIRSRFGCHFQDKLTIELAQTILTTKYQTLQPESGCKKHSPSVCQTRFTHSMKTKRPDNR